MFFRSCATEEKVTLMLRTFRG